ncbi:MAG TPA: excinuclease ABC subunit UvrA [Kofleriaceae bacterium]|nr:excinuclease ABC subunit UvrA [Kofleriaceae bacterium]
MASSNIEIRGARENNLRGVDLTIPKHAITIFTGVSGSGKSSIVFDTIATEAQRQLYENFSMFIRNFLPKYPPPAADAIEHLNMAVIVDQKRLGGGSHSTVGTVTDIYTVLRLLFSRAGKPHAGYANVFSFNDPQGMCPECNGLGKKLGVKADGFLDMSKSLSEGAVQVPVFAAWENNVYAACGFFDVKKKLSKFTKAEMDLLLHGTERKFKTTYNGQPFNARYEGIIAKFTRAYIKRDLKTRPERTQRLVEQHLTMGPCESCQGGRLNQAALASKIAGKNIAECAAMEIGDLLPWAKKIEGKVEEAITRTLAERLQAVVDIGLGYLSLDRFTDTLSGGESQRVKMVKHLGSSLVDVLYIFDEPSVGLHPRDVHRLGELLRALRDKGNTILVVEHDPDVIKIADRIVDVGPQAGTRGGTIVFEGTYAELQQAKTLTATHLFRESKIKDAPRRPQGKLAVKDAKANNLQDVSVDIPTGVLTVVTGVAGSGKSSLIHECFVPAHPEAVVIDQSAIGTSSRSTPATYTGVMDDLRKELADANGVDAGLFSFNSKGACEACNGLGVIYTDLAFLDGVKTPCETCHGQRFKDDVLAYTLGGKHVGDFLAMTVAEALQFFAEGPGAKAKKPGPLVKKLRAIRDVGIGYLTLGQPLNTLSGGECQRIKLASELHKSGSIYVMDEPTTGLHMSDITHLLAIVDRLVDAGNTVIIIEHNLDVVRHADWIIDLGPEGGSKGGVVVFEGTPAQLAKHKTSITARYVRGASAHD